MKSGVPLRAHLFKLLLNQRRRNLQGAKGASGAVILGPPVTPGIGRPVGEGTPWGGGGGGWIQIEPDQLHASIPDWGVTNGYATNTPAAGSETGGLAHKTDKSGFLDPPLTTGLVEAHNWSAFNPGGYGYPAEGLLQTHRLKGVQGTNNAGPSLYIGLDTPSTVTSAVTFHVIGSNPFQTSKQYIGLVNASSHQIQIGIGTDANGFGNAQSRYYDGSSWYYGTLRQRQSGNLAGSYIPLKVVFDPSASDIKCYWAGAELWNNLNQFADYPAEFPGWASFGAATTLLAAFSGTGTLYQYAMKVVFS